MYNQFSDSPDGNTRSKGNAGEDYACEVLISKGHRILCRNYTCRGGEIDIISSIGKYIVFTEVKMRSGNLSPMLAVTRKKIETVKRCAGVYLAEKAIVPGDGYSVRIDVITLRHEADGSISLISHIENLNLLGTRSKRF